MRNDSWSGVNNPTIEKFGEDYFNSLGRFYFETTDNAAGTSIGMVIPWSVWIDEIEGQDITEYAETNQNDDTISGVAVGYYPDNDGHWEISWTSGALDNLGAYQVRYSLTEFTNANYATNGTTITPLHYACTGGSGIVGKLVNAGNYYLYSTSFTLPSAYTGGGTRVFFAIKDVSTSGSYPCADLGGETNQRNASNSNIHTIDYIVGGGTDTIPPSKPQGLKIIN